MDLKPTRTTSTNLLINKLIIPWCLRIICNSRRIQNLRSILFILLFKQYPSSSLSSLSRIHGEINLCFCSSHSPSSASNILIRWKSICFHFGHFHLFCIYIVYIYMLCLCLWCWCVDSETQSIGKNVCNCAHTVPKIFSFQWGWWWSNPPFPKFNSQLQGMLLLLLPLFA